MHSTDELADGYMGSGKYLWNSIKKHGLENHKCEMLEHLPDRASLRAREIELVDHVLLEDKLCMNLKLGGEGGWEHVNKLDYIREIRCMNGRIYGFANRHLWSETAKKNGRKTSRQNGKQGSIKYRATTDQAIIKKNQMLGVAAALSEESRAKRKQAYQEIKHQQGEKNSQFGKRWIHKDNISLLIKSDELNQYFLNGYIIGRKSSLTIV
jgi:hypothetical protein